MKKICYIILVVMMSISLPACSSCTSNIDTSTEYDIGHDENGNIIDKDGIIVNYDKDDCRSAAKSEANKYMTYTGIMRNKDFSSNVIPNLATCSYKKSEINRSGSEEYYVYYYEIAGTIDLYDKYGHYYKTIDYDDTIKISSKTGETEK